MNEIEIVERLATAIAVGLLVGVERGWRDRAGGPGSRTAGIRTFAIIGLTGGLAGLIAIGLGGGVAGAIIVAAMFLATIAPVAVFKARENVRDQDFSVTTVVAASAVFALGVLAMLGDFRIAAAGAVVLTGILLARERLHGMLDLLTYEELRAGVLLLAMTLVVLPLAPDRPLLDNGAVNPREIWLIAIIIAAASTLAYVLLKLAGPTRGLGIGGAIGGLVSSTAVTLALARQAAEADTQHGMRGAAASLAGATSLLRLGALPLVVMPALSLSLAPAVGAAALAMAAVSLVRLSSADRGGSAAFDLRYPFELRPVFVLATLVALISFVAGWAKARFGDEAVLGLAFLAGLSEIEPYILSVSRLAEQGMAMEFAQRSILVAMVVQLLVKIGLGWFIGGRRFGIELLVATAAGVAAGGVAEAVRIGWLRL
jgi:uncharacterized membrane protein (DUF4010 family)